MNKILHILRQAFGCASTKPVAPVAPMPYLRELELANYARDQKAEYSRYLGIDLE